MLGGGCEGLQDHQVERALGEFDVGSHWFPFHFYRKDTRTPVEVQGGNAWRLEPEVRSRKPEGLDAGPRSRGEKLFARQKKNYILIP